MSEVVVDPAENVEPRRSLAEWVRRNPVVLKELRGRMRGNRAFIVLTVYLLLLSLPVALAYGLFLISSSQAMGSVTDRQGFGKAIFGIVVGMELLSLSFIAPALTAGGISGEREHQTYDLLRTTLLPARSLVLGKFISGLLFMLLLLLAALPLQSLSFLFGGVAPEEVVVATLLLVVTAITFCAVGIFFSSFMKRTLASTVLSYAYPVLMVFGLPMMFWTFLALLSSLVSGVSSQALTVTGEILLFIAGWLLVATNPIATMVASEIVLLEEQSLLLFSLPLSNGSTITLISPWVPYVLISLLSSLILLWAAVRFVKRVEK